MLLRKLHVCPFELIVLDGLHESNIELDRFYQNGSPLKYVPDIKYCPHKDLQLLLEAFFGRITKCHTKEKNNARYCSAPTAEGNFVSEIRTPKN
jgi:hypothetical protein